MLFNRSSSKILLAILASILLFFVFFEESGRVRLWDPDESYYAQAPREMVERGDFMCIVFNGEPLYDKPAFFYWLTLAAQTIGGVTEHAIRFPSALAAVLIVTIVFLWSRRGEMGAPVGWASALIASTSVEFFVFSRIATPDMTLTFFLLATLFGFYRFLEGGERPRDLALAWAAAGLGSFTKGPVGLVLPLLCVVAYLLTQKQIRRFGSLFRPIPILLFAALALPWYLYMSLWHPDYVWTFLVEHNLKRFTSPMYHHAQPFWYFVPVFIAGIFPWLFHLLSEIRSAIREKHRLFALASITVIILFFSPSGSKLPGYILAAFPLAAIVAGPAVLSVGRRCILLNALLVMQILAIALLSQSMIFKENLILFSEPALPSLLMILTVVVASGAACFMLPLRSWAQVVAGACAVLSCMAAMGGLETYKPAERILQDVAARGNPPFATLRLQRRESPFLPSLVYYYGAGIPELRNRADLISFFKHKERILCIVNQKDFQQVPWESWLPLYRIADYTDINYTAVLISNRPDSDVRQQK